MHQKWIIPAALLGAALTASAQTKTIETQVRSHTSERTVMMTSGSMAGGNGGPGAFGFIAAAHADGKVVKNASYSAEATTETIRVLADGTRIVNKDTNAMARDKEGRTRRENSFRNIGPWANANAGHTPPTFITITDPVAKEVYILNLTERTANKSKLGEPMMFRAESSSGNTKHVMEEKVMIRGSATAAASHNATFDIAIPAMPAAGATFFRFDSKNEKSEDLGRQTMEGVAVEGARSTMTIPAGEIGNDRAIVSITERWYSPELQMVIFTKTTDPQFGESTYRVSNLKRTEPDPSLFKIPADFKIQENPAGGDRIRMHRRLEGPPPPEQF